MRYLQVTLGPDAEGKGDVIRPLAIEVPEHVESLLYLFFRVHYSGTPYPDRLFIRSP